MSSWRNSWFGWCLEGFVVAALCAALEVSCALSPFSPTAIAIGYAGLPYGQEHWSHLFCSRSLSVVAFFPDSYRHRLCRVALRAIIQHPKSYQDEHLHICTFSHLHIYISAHLHICTSAHLKKAKAFLIFIKKAFAFFSGWMMGLEPTTLGTTNRCSNQLSYNHRVT